MDVASYTDRDVETGKTYSYRVAAFNATGMADYTNVVSVTIDGVIDPTLSVSDPYEFEMLYPNPAVDEIYLPVTLSQKATAISIYDMSGEMAEGFQRSNTSIEKIDVSDLSQGVYLIHVSTPGGEVIRKFYKE
ncbi:T9SS type A sorting domain-containing protein [Fulvivirga sp. M361]|uniref:T9SS type A sorting domain-containing protein n=1 Tax=Fulvivirga sp. M361 TaxID=2594266 RepID=UPI0011947D21|nr:T9SS type A sorting domain-containing protein [Fulvivirga sp. M361]TRX61856.1 T9SS type A sorting domain-containing protein [Fulvivirga sp. M361]